MTMIRVLIVDDSPTVRLLLQTTLEADPEIRVAGFAVNGQDAVQQTNALRPDIVTMDVEMPLLNGIEATRLIMEQCPTPIVIVTSHSSDNDAVTFNALRMGALQVLEKPTDLASQMRQQERDLFVATIKALSEVRVVRRRFDRSLRTSAASGNQLPQLRRRVEIVAIGASTGGPAALNAVLRTLPATLALPLVIVQHITAGFTQGLVEWLQHDCLLPLHIVLQPTTMAPGTIYFAPDERHLFVRNKHLLDLSDAPPVNHVRPSVDVLFESVARCYGGATAAALLTGMGEDGAAGLQAVYLQGGITIAQDEATSIVYGMPKAAADLGVCNYILPLPEIGPRLVSLLAG
jgi:two-component system chemotaxis response regulator CheB